MTHLAAIPSPVRPRTDAAPDARPPTGRPMQPAPFSRSRAGARLPLQPQVAGRHPNLGPRGVRQHPQQHSAASPAVRGAPAHGRPAPPPRMGPLTRVQAAAGGVAEIVGRRSGAELLRHPVKTAVGSVAAFVYGLFRPLHR